MKPTPEKIAAFKEKMKHMPNGCIEWQGNIDSTGYGRFCFHRQTTLAHRASWMIFRGEIPNDLCILHKCDNPPCVNPDHLFVGDRKDNAKDMSAKGRQWVQKNPAGRPICPTELKARGEQHGMSKMTDEIVKAIRIRASEGTTGKVLAHEYSCSRSLISQIIRGEIWAHADGPIKKPNRKGNSND